MWTPQQLAIFDAVENTTDSIMVEAVPGSGKTTTLVEAAKRLPANGLVLALAFNVKIKDELKERLPPTVICKTMNGLGHSAVCKLLARRVAIDSRKMGNIVTEICDKFNLNDRWKEILALASAAKTFGLVPDGTSSIASPVMPDTEESWQEIADFLDIELDDLLIHYAKQAVKISIDMVIKDGIIDFDDQIYFAACWPVSFTKYSVVLIDEAQDLSKLERVMLRKLGKTRIIACGDRRQSIYGFRGADPESIPLLIQQFNLRQMPLTVSWRCAKNIVLAAKQIYPEIEYAENAVPGTVATISEFTPTAGDAILCRNNAPLIALAYKLIRQGKSIMIRGRNLSAEMKRLIDQLTKKNKDMPISEFLQKLEAWKISEIELATKNNRFGKAHSTKDKADALVAVINHTHSESIAELKSAITKLFSATRAEIVLSTIHQAKGLEWDTVYFYLPALIPSYFAVKSEIPWMLEQEQNTYYIGITRAKNSLYFVQPEE